MRKRMKEKEPNRRRIKKALTLRAAGNGKRSPIQARVAASRRKYQSSGYPSAHHYRRCLKAAAF